MRPVFLAANVENIGADAVAGAEGFPRNQLVFADNRFSTAEIDRHITIFHALDGTVDDFAHAVFEFIVLALALGVFHALHDHLFRGLCGDTTEIDRRQFIAHHFTHFMQRFWELLFRLRHGHLLRGIKGRVALGIDRGFGFVGHDLDQAMQRNCAGFTVNRRFDVMLKAVFFAASDLNRVFHRFQHRVAVDIFFTRHRIGDL